MKLKCLAFGARDEDGSEVEKGTTGIQITSCETNLKPVSHTGEWREEDEYIQEVGGGGGGALHFRGTERLPISP